MKTIAFIHGANATNKSFSFIRSKLPEHDAISINYDTKNPLEKNINICCEKIKEINESFCIISHSLGGIIGLALSQMDQNIEKLVTIGTPFGGSKEAGHFSFWMPQIQLFNDISTISPILSRIKRKGTPKPTLSIISAGGGSHLITEKNDGVVSVESQKSLKGPVYFESNLNHFETLLCDDIVEEIRKFIWT